MNKALFLDLDGTIIKTKTGKTFPKSINDWQFIPNVVSRIGLYHAAGYKIFIVSNQGGISLNYLTEQDFITKITNICTAIEKELKLPTNVISFQYCKEMEDYNRKPKPGMAYELAMEHELDLSHSIMVGDRPEDLDFAMNAGIHRYMWIEDFVAISVK